MKACTTCKEVKPLEQYSKKGGTRDGVRAVCKSCVGKYMRDYNAKKEVKERISAYRIERMKDPEYKAKKREKDRMYRLVPENKARYNERQRIKDRARRKNDPAFVMKQRMAHMVGMSLRARGYDKMGRSWEAIVGYTKAQLMEHLEAQFVKGMTWDNIGLWHVDHIVPISTFKFSSMDDPEFKAAWCLSNLRPLWARENMSKQDKRIYLL